MADDIFGTPKSNRYPGLDDPERQCAEHVAPFVAVMTEWQGRFPPRSLEWHQLGHAIVEASEIIAVLNEKPRSAPLEHVERRAANES